MFKFLILFGAVGFALAVSDDATAELNERNLVISPEGTFKYNYKISNGIDVSSSGDEHSMSGTIDYISPDGTPIHLTYIADENGFQPLGEHLPTPPPTPEAILRSLEWLQTHASPPTVAKLPVVEKKIELL